MEKGKPSVAIIGAGAAGLIAADRLSALRPDVAITLFDAMPSPARKVLMAGKSGLNISHQTGIDDPDLFARHYGKGADWMRPMLADCGTQEILHWMKDLGQTCFTGSSGRIFPKAMKASPFLRALLARLGNRGVALQARHRWMGWDEDGAHTFQTLDGLYKVKTDATLLALGGPSWPKLGTDGSFLALLADKGLATRPYRPANCGFDVDWPSEFCGKWSGTPVKSVRLVFEEHSAQGDFVITQNGIEGGTVYALSAPLRDHIENDGAAILHVDLRSNQMFEQIRQRLARPRGKQSMANHLRKSLNLKGVQAALLKACTDRSVMDDIDALATAIKALPLRIERPRPTAEAISTAGGICLSELDGTLMSKANPGLFLAGEMLDWEAPTGGYLLTACLSQGYRAAGGIADYLD